MTLPPSTDVVPKLEKLGSLSLSVQPRRPQRLVRLRIGDLHGDGQEAYLPVEQPDCPVAENPDCENTVSTSSLSTGSMRAQIVTVLFIARLPIRARDAYGEHFNGGRAVERGGGRPVCLSARRRHIGPHGLPFLEPLLTWLCRRLRLDQCNPVRRPSVVCRSSCLDNPSTRWQDRQCQRLHFLRTKLA